MRALLVILGPTASGKTALGIEIAKKVGGAVVSADSRQVYAGFNIGTAKPPAAFRTQPHPILEPEYVDSVPHYLLNIARPTTTYSLANWQHDTYHVIENILPSYSLLTTTYPLILVGGTMLYLDSIIYNYSLPQVPPNEVLRQELAQRDTADLYQELVTADPAAKQFVEPHHQRRIIRALEVIAATGKPFSALRQKQPPRYPLQLIGLFPGWDMLKENITQRAQQMLNEGLVEETQRLRTQFSSALPLLKTMNYLQAGKIIDGQLSREEAIAEMVTVNTRYARQQMSWWKNRKEINWFETADIHSVSRFLRIP